MKTTVVYRIFGDRETGNAIKNGIVSGGREAASKLAEVKAELNTLKQREAKISLSESHMEEYWRYLIRKARRNHGHIKKTNIFLRPFEAIWAMVWYLIHTSYLKFSAIKRR